MRIEIDALSQKGLVRENNEDALAVGDKILRDDAATVTVELQKKGFFYLLVADGMGGHENAKKLANTPSRPSRNCSANVL